MTSRIAPDAMAMPPQSLVRFGCLSVVGTSHAASRTTAMPIGMLTRKIGRQSSPNRSPAMSTPPINGPATEPRPAVRPKKEKACARSCGGNITWAMASTCGIIMAPVMP